MPCNDVKLVDVPEMNYVTVNPGGNPRGEVCFKGPNVFSGYFKDEAHTREALDDEGWLHSGDIGEWLPNGALRIIDRKKNIFKLSQGEYVAAEKIENILVTAPLVAQVFVYGDSLQSVLVAVVVPDVEVCKTLPWGADLQALCKNPEFKKVRGERAGLLWRRGVTRACRRWRRSWRKGRRVEGSSLSRRFVCVWGWGVGAGCCCVVVVVGAETGA